MVVGTMITSVEAGGDRWPAARKARTPTQSPAIGTSCVYAERRPASSRAGPDAETEGGPQREEEIDAGDGKDDKAPDPHGLPPRPLSPRIRVAEACRPAPGVRRQPGASSSMPVTPVAPAPVLTLTARPSFPDQRECASQRNHLDARRCSTT